ncbi:hypothetical protein GCM10011339_08480 [Echinicola rosea]|uniref:Lipocalin-like domain-containing protein n=2 Tax=Echinicola rosea TaxID=1807691 RepID=A0ABQ1UP36_9BACT|nr:hypothetical protein GCM10011339_08480 [Echinicola rosea]
MKALWLIIGFTFTVMVANCQDLDTSMLVGKWKMSSYDVIDNVRLSDHYRSASPQVRERMDRKIARYIDNTFYHFTSQDSVFYTDLSEGTVVQKSASYILQDNGILVIKSEEGKKEKKAKVKDLTIDHLVMSPIGDDGKAKGEMILKRIQ